ncbi:MAG: 3-dehydroquinate synthase, partial [Planctomycetota bacterium]
MTEPVRFEVETEPRCPVVIGAGALGEVAAIAARHSRSLVVSDATVANLHAARLAVGTAALHVVATGERAKSFAQLEKLLEAMAAARLDRASLVIALGGGSVGDVAGLAAALYMRGIAVLQCPTTLLAMADSSIGGKTAIDVAAGKNLVGAFHQPIGVLADTSTLATLPAAELASGFGEVVKCALLAGERELALVEQSAARLVAREEAALAQAVELCARLKARIVAADPRERGERKLLNLGHTFAHAIEKVAGYGTIPHGVAVGCGVALACDASAHGGHLADARLPARVRALLAALGLYGSLAELEARYARKLDHALLLDAMRLDKKSAAGELRLVLPSAPGDVRYGIATPESELLRALAAHDRAPHHASGFTATRP